MPSGAGRTVCFREICDNFFNLRFSYLIRFMDFDDFVSIPSTFRENILRNMPKKNPQKELECAGKVS